MIESNKCGNLYACISQLLQIFFFLKIMSEYYCPDQHQIKYDTNMFLIIKEKNYSGVAYASVRGTHMQL